MCKISDKSDTLSLNYSNLFRGPLFSGHSVVVDVVSCVNCMQVDGVLAVHEFHIWQLAGNRIIASAHIRCRNLRDYMRIAEEVKSFFHNEGIHSTTIQPEFVEASHRASLSSLCIVHESVYIVLSCCSQIVTVIRGCKYVDLQYRNCFQHLLLMGCFGSAG